MINLQTTNPNALTKNDRMVKASSLIHRVRCYRGSYCV